MLNQRQVNASWKPSKSQRRPLTPKQKTFLGRLCSKAYALAKKNDLHDSLNGEDWRHREAIAIVGCRISEAKQWQFEALAAHFAQLAGDTKTAFEFAMRDSDEGRAKRQAMAVLFSHLHKLPEAELISETSYAKKICFDKFRVGLELATAAQIQQVAMTVKERVAAKKKAAQEGNGLALARAGAETSNKVTDTQDENKH